MPRQKTIGEERRFNKIEEGKKSEERIEEKEQRSKERQEMKKTGEGLEQGEGGVTRFSVKLSFSSANVTDCDGARCHIAVPVNTHSKLREKACAY